MGHILEDSLMRARPTPKEAERILYTPEDLDMTKEIIRTRNDARQVYAEQRNICWRTTKAIERRVIRENRLPMKHEHEGPCNQLRRGCQSILCSRGQMQRRDSGTGVKQTGNCTNKEKKGRRKPHDN